MRKNELLTQKNHLIKLNRFFEKRHQKEVCNAIVNGARHVYYIVYRQGGKTQCVSKIFESYLLQDRRWDSSPLAAIATPTVVQAKATYDPKLLDIFGSLKPTFNDNTWRMNHPRFPYCAIEYFGMDKFGAGEGSDSKRGRTTVVNAGDEYGSFAEGAYQKFIEPFGDRYSAPNILLGTTSRGPNHFKTEYEDAKYHMERGDKEYFAIKWNIEDALRAGEITQAFYDSRRKRYDTPALRHIWKGEYLLDWDAYQLDQIYARFVSEVERDGRIGHYPYMPGVPVDTFWDIGKRGTAVWFVQSYSGYRRFIRYAEEVKDAYMQQFFKDEILPHRDKYNYRFHVFPHDMHQGEWMSPENRYDTARKILPGQVRVYSESRRTRPFDAIDYARGRFDRIVFHKPDCAKGIERLRNYRRNKQGDPEKDKESHGADAFTLSQMATDLYKLDNHQLAGLGRGMYFKRGRPKPFWRA